MKIPLYAFPYAGAAAHVFGGIARDLRNGDLIAVEYPGRGRRILEPCLNQLSEVVEDVLVHYRERFEAGPYAVFGHSMGAHVAALLGLRLAEEGIRLPLVAVLSGASAPTHRVPDGDHALPQAEFIARLREIGGFDPSVLASPELMELFEPILRADFEACDEYPWPTGAQLPFPIVAACGREDGEVRGPSFEAWAGVAAAGCELRELPGGHFFAFQESRRDLVELVDEAVSRYSGELGH